MLEIKQDPAAPEVWIDGVRYHEGVFKTLAAPEKGRFYAFSRDDDVVTVEDVTETIYDDLLEAYRNSLTSARLHGEGLQRQRETALIMADRYKKRFEKLAKLVRAGNDVELEEFFQELKREEKQVNG